MSDINTTREQSLVAEQQRPAASSANLAPQARQTGDKVLGIEIGNLDSQVRPALLRVQKRVTEAQMELSRVSGALEIPE